MPITPGHIFRTILPHFPTKAELIFSSPFSANTFPDLITHYDLFQTNHWKRTTKMSSTRKS